MQIKVMDRHDDGDEEIAAELEAELASMTVHDRAAMLQSWKEDNGRGVWSQSREPLPNSENLWKNSPHAEHNHRADYSKRYDDTNNGSFPVSEQVKIEVTGPMESRQSDSPLTIQEPRPISPNPNERLGYIAAWESSQTAAPITPAPKPVSGGVGKKFLARISKAAEPYEAKFLETTAPARKRISRATSPAFQKISASASPSVKKLSQYTNVAAGKMMLSKEDFVDFARVNLNQDYLCSQCTKFPFEACLPSTDSMIENTGMGTVFRTSLRRIVRHRVGCRLCRFLLKAFCLPENDPFNHSQVFQHLEPRFRYEKMKTWIAKVDESGIWYAYWHWPFGQDPDQGPSIRESWRYPFGDPNRVHSGEEHFDEGSTHVLGPASRLAGKFAVNLAINPAADTIFSQQNILPCYVEIEVKSYKDPLTCGLLHVKLFGHGRGPRAPLTVLSSFRLRVATNFSHDVDLSLPHPPLRFGQIIEQQKINVSIGAMWLHECEQQHGTKCSEHGWSVVMQKPSFLRLIDVQDNCIVEVAEPEKCRFVALSYVWGGAQHLQLQRHNKAELMAKNGLNTYRSAISQTILDAMIVVQGIGERYLWVDSMCILQDDDDPEKLEQINRMDQIYGSAIVTIVAADAANANAGLEGVREGSRSVMQLAEELRPGFHIMAPTAVPQQLDKSPWNLRAWTMQERLLSRRFLIFTGGQVIWYCRGRVMFEDMAVEDKGEEYTPLYWLSLKPQYLGVNTRVGYVDGSIEVTRERITRIVRSGTFNEYSRLIEEYSQRQITYTHDVLNALAGLLHIFELCFKYPVRKGLPEILLDVAILWRPCEPLTSRACKELPSWSWAGWIGKVAYEEPFSSIVNIDGQNMRVRQENGQERIRPLLRWYSWNTISSEFEAINKNGLGIPFGMNENETLPYEWEKTLNGEDLPAPCAMYLPEGLPSLLDDRHLIFWTICSTAFRFEEETRGAVENSGQLPKAPLRRTIFGKEGLNPVGTILLDGQGPARFDARIHEFIVISEAQYYGIENETAQQGEFMDYPLYNVMLIQWDERRQIASRLGMGRVEKTTWRQVERHLQIVVLA